MAATIRLQEETLGRLKEAKEERGAQSYDELIRRLLREARARKSRFGVHPWMTPFRHERTSHGFQERA